MAQSQQLLQALQFVLANDFKRTNSVANFFLTHAVKGGWEGWLQAEFARAVFEAFPKALMDREKIYTGDMQKCDLWFKPERGTDMWVELKAQRSNTYANAVLDFVADVKKIAGLNQEFRKTNVLCAFAVMRLQGSDANDLNLLRSNAPSGLLQYFKYNGIGWVDVTPTIAKEPLTAIVMATYRNT